MPNHFHGIIIFSQPPMFARAKKPATLSNIVGALKSKTNLLSRQKLFPNRRKIELWQKTFYDRVIRNESELEKVREYIINNPRKWELDEYYRA